MGFGVFIHRSDSIYDDSPAEQYQFPSQYLGRVEAWVGDWIIYYEPSKVTATRGYFAIARSPGCIWLEGNGSLHHK
jgi:putative restriction endonuclease